MHEIHEYTYVFLSHTYTGIPYEYMFLVQIAIMSQLSTCRYVNFST